MKRRALFDNRTFLLGDLFTTPDAYVFKVSNWAKNTGVDLSNLSRVQLMKQGSERSAVRAAMEAEGRLTAA